MGRTVRVEFANWLREQLRSKGWMVSDFAQAVGVRPSAVYRWTAGQRAPTDSQVEKIATALAVPVAEVWRVLERSGVTPAIAPATSTPRPARSGPVVTAEESPRGEFARWLADVLAERGWTPGFFARAVDLDPVTVRAWLAGLRTPAFVQAPRLASVLGIDQEQIQRVLTGGLSSGE